MAVRAYRRQRSSRAQAQQAGVAWRFLAGSLIFLLLVTIFPLFYALWTSLHSFYLFSPDQTQFVGLGNYVATLTDPLFAGSLVHTLIFSGGTVAAELVLGYILALILNHELKGFGLLRSLVIAPILLAPVIVALMWLYMYDPNFGVVNYVMSLLHLPTRAWLSDVSTALPAVMIANIWEWTPFVFLVFVAGMRSISAEIMEAAAIDGVRTWSATRYILVPLLRPLILVVLLILVIDSLKSFDLIFVMTRGGPGTATYTLPINTWIQAFSSYQMGSASAVAFIIVILINIAVIGLNNALKRSTVDTRTP